MKTRHAGDCWIYAVNGVCTCGFLHSIIRDPESDEYEAHEEEIIKHQKGLYFLNGLREGIPEPSKEQQEEAQKMLDRMFGGEM
jgi:hypothetical protein